MANKSDNNTNSSIFHNINNDEIIKEPTIQEFLIEKLDESFRSSLPIETLRQLPRKYLYLFGVLTKTISLAVFLLFCLYVYNGQLKQTFISLDSTAGNCQAVDKALTGTYYASMSGYWEGEEMFDYKDAIYLFSFSNLQFTNNPYEEFKLLLLNFQKTQLNPIGSFACKQILTTNLLFWMNYYFEYNTVSGSQQTFQFTGSPSAVFSTFFYQLSISSAAGDCTAVLPSSFNSYTATLTTAISLSDYVGYGCDEIISPYYLGYSNKVLDATSLILPLDYNSFTTALAVNQGILSYDILTTIDDSSDIYIFNNVTYLFTLKISQRFPGMQPIVCAENITDTAYDTISKYPITRYCFMYIKSVNETSDYVLPFIQSIAIPVFNQYQDCYCEGSNSYSSLNVTNICNQFNLISNLLLYSPNYSSPESFSNVTYNIFHLLSIYTPQQINNYTYYASALTYANSDLYSSTNETEYDEIFENYQSRYEFCNGCSLISTISSMNLGTPLNNGKFGGSVNAYGYQLLNGACNDSFTSPNWERLASNPPASLTESYYKCTPSTSSALSSTFGIAAGDAATVIPILLLLLLPALYMILNNLSILPKKDKYTKEEKEIALNELAELLLTVRDKNKDNHNTNEFNSTYSNKLVNELIEYGISKEKRLKKAIDDDDKLKSNKSKRRYIRKSIFTSSKSLTSRKDSVKFEVYNGSRNVYKNENKDIEIEINPIVNNS